jgi:hypothetical protein
MKHRERICPPWRRIAFTLTCALALAAPVGESAAADHIKIGVVRSLGGSPAYLAKEKGFFDAEGLDAELVFFESAQPISVAVASGDANFGTTGLTAAFFNLASQGALKIIGSSTWETPGFQNTGFLVSNQAYAAGLTSAAAPPRLRRAERRCTTFWRAPPRNTASISRPSGFCCSSRTRTPRPRSPAARPTSPCRLRHPPTPSWPKVARGCSAGPAMSCRAARARRCSPRPPWRMSMATS